jgi:hypothetical protein
MRFLEQHLTTLGAENITQKCIRTLYELDSVLGSIAELTKGGTEPITSAGRRGYIPQQLKRQMEQLRCSSPNKLRRKKVKTIPRTSITIF